MNGSQRLDNQPQPSIVRFSASIGADDATEKKSNTRKNRPKSKRRNKFLLEGVRQELLNLQRENEYLRILIRERIRPIDLAEKILAEAEAPPVDIYLKSSVLMDEEKEYIENHAGVRENMKKGDADLLGKKQDSIPRVLSLKNVRKVTRTSVDCQIEEAKDPSYHSGEIESLAAALSGDFAF